MSIDYHVLCFVKSCFSLCDIKELILLPTLKPRFSRHLNVIRSSQNAGPNDSTHFLVSLRGKIREKAASFHLETEAKHEKCGWGGSLGTRESPGTRCALKRI